MKTYLASAIVLAALCGTAHAATTTVGSTAANECFAAAQKDMAGALPQTDRHAALEACTTALGDKLRPEDRTATLVNAGILNAGSGNIEVALANYNEALARNPNASEVYIDRGSALLRAQRFSDARADFDHALTLGTPNTAIALFNRGVANEKSGDLKAAYRDYKQAATVNPDFKPAVNELARFKVTEGQVAKS